MNAAQQSAVVSLCESIREHGGHVIVPDKKQINDKHWLPALAKALESHIAEFSGCCDRFRALKDAADQNPAAQQQPTSLPRLIKCCKPKRACIRPSTTLS